MFDLQHSMIEAEARHRMAERAARAAEPRLTDRRVAVRPGARVARRLRTLADRLDP